MELLLIILYHREIVLLSVSIRAYFLKKYYNSSGTVLTLRESFVNGLDSDFNRIKNALSITSMNDLVNYSFTSSQDSTSRDILSVWQINQTSIGTVYYYNVSGAITTQEYFIPDGPYTLTFTRRT